MNDIGGFARIVRFASGLQSGYTASAMYLALDSSTLTLSLALLAPETPPAAAAGPLGRHGPRVLEEVALPPPRRVSEMLPGEIQALLLRHGVSLRSLSGLAVGLGPGSFTGLRLGLASVKALAYAASVPTAGVSSLAALALDAPATFEDIFALAVAQRGELYVGHYRRHGESVLLAEPERAESVAEVARLLAQAPGACALGPALDEYADALAGHLAPGRAGGATMLPGHRHPRASAIGALATIPTAYTHEALFALEPRYVRAAAAERDPKFPPLPGPAPVARLKEHE